MMLASTGQSPSSTMSFPSEQSSPPKRPRLSLQTSSTVASFGPKSATTLKADIDPTSPTAFNTLSNAYAAAIENSTPIPSLSGSASGNKNTPKGKPSLLRLETSIVDGGNNYTHPSKRTQTPGPFAITFPDTPSSAFPATTPVFATPISDITTSMCTFTPPQSAGSTDQSIPRIFTFTANAPSGAPPTTPRMTRRRVVPSNSGQDAPYTHPRSLHSILRNSPLPPRSTVTPATPSRMSLRLANRAAKKVGYNDPLTQTITTNKYVKSHIDLLAEESPYSATDQEADTLDSAMSCAVEPARDGEQTPGPFEEMRRRMAESGLETPATRKRKRKEKKRKWEWTITSVETTGEATAEGGVNEKTPLTAVRRETTPDTAVWRGGSVSTDSEMSDVEESRFVMAER